MNSDGKVWYERRGEVVTITFDRQASRNAMTWAMWQELTSALQRIEDENGARVVVLRGAGGKAFIAGTDIKQFTDFETADDGVLYEEKMENVLSRLESLPLPTIAVVEGYAVGGGLVVAAVCDLRICTPDAKFGTPIARTIGNCFSLKNYARLCALIGASRTKALILGAGLLSAEEAHASGLVMDVVSPEELDERVNALCGTLVRHAPITMRVTKEAVRRLVLSGAAAVDGDDLVREAYGSRDFREGVRAFVERRSPEWENR